MTQRYGNSGSYAVLINRRASLASDFGDSYGRRLFGDHVIDQLPTFTRGPRKGLHKGYLHWTKSTRGGWSREFKMIVGPNRLIRAAIREGEAETSTPYYLELLAGTGRIEAANLSAGLLGPEMQARLAELAGIGAGAEA